MHYSKAEKRSRKLKISFSDIGVDKLLTIASALIFILFISTIFFSDKNIFVLKEKIELKNALEGQITQLSQENKRLHSQIEYLKNDNFFIEKKAREDLGLIREGEEIYILVGYKPQQRQQQTEYKDDRWIDKVIAKYRQYRLKDD